MKLLSKSFQAQKVIVAEDYVKVGSGPQSAHGYTIFAKNQSAMKPWRKHIGFYVKMGEFNSCVMHGSLP